MEELDNLNKLPDPETANIENLIVEKTNTDKDINKDKTTGNTEMDTNEDKTTEKTDK
jgi:hypothetical protein